VTVREVVDTSATGDVDTAVFSGPRADYDVVTVGPVTTVTHARGTAADGTDTLTQVERLQFSDTTIDTPPPASVPAAPTAVTAMAGNGTATVSFVAPADGGSPITSFQVVATTGTTVTTTTGIAPTATSAVVTGLTNGAPYTFRVRAVNAVGQGPLSTASASVTPVNPVVPGAPTIGAATASDASATVRWTAPAPNGGPPITAYRVQVRIGATLVSTVTGLSPTATSTVVTGLTNGTAYNFRVRAVNTVGVGPLSAASAPVTPSSVPGAPAIGTATAGAVGGAITATATWAAPATNGGSAITGYRVTALRLVNGVVQSTTVSDIRPATARSFAITLPTTGNYRFTVSAFNARGEGPQSPRSNLVAGR